LPAYNAAKCDCGSPLGELTAYSAPSDLLAGLKGRGNGGEGREGKEKRDPGTGMDNGELEQGRRLAKAAADCQHLTRHA